MNYEQELRSREKGKFDDDNGYRFGRNQNIDKQEISKLCVAQTVPGMRVCYDSGGKFYLNNVRVNGIIPDDIDTGWFLLGILYSPLVDFIFKRIAKPKEGGYYEANKQFIAPLPIPCANDEKKSQVVEKAKQLQELHGRRRDLLLAIDKRLESPQCVNDNRDEIWLWADVKPLAKIKKDAPSELKGRKLTAWAKERREPKPTERLDAINAMLRPGAALNVIDENDGLQLLADNVPLIEGIFLDESEADFIAAQWRQKTRRINVTEKFEAKRLINQLLKLRKTENDAIKTQVVKLDANIQTIDENIEKAEADMNRLTYRLYGLTEEEVKLVEGR